MRPAALALLFALLLFAPTAAAGWNPLAPRIDLPAFRTGDLFRYTQTVDEVLEVKDEGSAGAWVKPSPPKSTIVVEVEGPNEVRDRFGVLTAVETFRVQQADEAQLLRDVRCHKLPSGGQALRTDHLVDEPDYWWVQESSALQGLYTSESRKDFTPVAGFEVDTCDGDSLWDGRTLREGERIGIWSPTLAPGMPRYTRYLESSPAVATEFHGRPALVFTWAVEDLLTATYEGSHGTLRVTLADGLAPLARVEVDAVIEDATARRVVRAATELVGFSPGVGAPLTSGGNRQGSWHNPVGRFASYDPLAIDDAAFRFPYPFAEAMAALRSDPRLDLDSWLAAHPDAYLSTAIYERHMVVANGPMGATEPTETDGGWYLHFSDADSHRAFVTIRSTGLATPAGALTAPTKVVQSYDSGSSSTAGGATRFPEQVQTSGDMARLIALEGLDPTRLESYVHIAYPDATGKPSPLVFASEVPYMFSSPGDDEGIFLAIAAETGGLHYAKTSARSRTTGGVLGETIAPVSGDDSRGAALAALAGTGAPGIAAGAAATGLALLFVLVKFVLVPLFTRLRRDALLDHPVRARLHERVRSDPGIHLADLVECAGVGYGATRHHLEHLVKARLLAELEADGFKRYYASGSVPPADARRAAVLRHETTRRVYDLLVAEPRLSLRDAGRRLDLSAPTVHRVKKRLEKEGLLPAAEDPLVALAPSRQA